jgi:aquaporin Z
MNFKAYVAEFIGTFALIFVGVGAIATNNLMAGALGLTGIALAHGLTIAVMASATAAVSGGHLNPAVTFGAIITRKIDLPNGLGYMGSQILGGIAGAVMITLVMPEAATDAVSLGIPALGADVTSTMGVLMELILTFFLVFVVFGTAIDKRAPQVGALFIGLAVTLDILAGGSITGAAMNPARYLGPAIVSGDFSQLWIYLVGPLAGGALAALVYHYVLEEK